MLPTLFSRLPLTMASIQLVFVFLLNVLLFISVTGTSALNLGTEVAPDDQVCATKLSSCAIHEADSATMTVTVTRPTQGPKGEKGERGWKGEKGIPGITGAPGLPGDAGKNGTDGIPGQDGARGIPGISGEKGERGPTGPPSTPGQQGLMGEKGLPGVPGNPGRDSSKGERGNPGLPGLAGPPGAPGKMGSCPCVVPEIDTGENDDATPTAPIGTLTNPANVVCNKKNTIGEFIYMGPGKVKVKCEIHNGSLYTCIPPASNIDTYADKAITYTSEKEPFWLSSKGLSLKEIYNLTYDQIMWIQEKSNSGFQRLRYHCKNSMPYNPKDPDHSMQMLTWNDMLFGPTPNEITPFVYTVPNETDGCLHSTDKDKFSSSVIVIESYSAQRLPVVDFLIRDSRDEAKSVYVEHLEICFNKIT